MISSYRLGDLILLDLNSQEKNEILKDFPNSFGSKFIHERQNNDSEISNIDIITKIVSEYINNNAEKFPKNIADSSVIHLRLGDVIAGNEWHEIVKRPLSIEYYQSILKDDINPKYIIGQCFFAKTSSQNYEECIKESSIYLNEIKLKLQAEHFSSGNADIDLCCGVKSKLFIQGKGFFSKLIVEIRKKLNLECIETNICN